MARISAWGLWTTHFGLAMSIMAEAEEGVRAHGLELKELFLLDKVDAHPSPAGLARALLTPKPTITFMVKRMEAAGFLRRETPADDLRRFRLTLTPSGRRAMEASRTVLEEAFGRRLARLTRPERVELAALLGRLSEPAE